MFKLIMDPEKKEVLIQTVILIVITVIVIMNFLTGPPLFPEF